MSELSPAEYDALLRQDFGSFTHRAFNHLHPTQKFMANWDHEVICAKFEECRTGKCRRLIITKPPRHLKSLYASVSFPAYVLGHDPTRQFLCLSYGQKLANKHARDCRSVITSHWFKRLFPGTVLSDNRQAVAAFTTTVNGGRVATSVNGVITGFGADYIVIDDPIKVEDALSATRRRAVNEWMDCNVYGRLNDRNLGCVILVMQRGHEDDLVGHVQQQTGEKWEVLNFPAIAEQPESFHWETVFGKFSHHRAVGDVLHAERETFEQLQARKADIGEYNFASQYQQNPAPLGGGMVKREQFKFFRKEDLPDDARIIQCWDTANKPSEFNDFSVCATLALKGRDVFLLDIWRQKVDYPGLKRAVQHQHDTYRPSTILIEDRASGVQLLQELREMGLSVVPYKSRLDKVMRFAAQIGVIKDGHFYLLEPAHWRDAFLHEVLTFPASRFDDQVDAISMALEWVSLEGMRRAAAEPVIQAYEIVYGQGATKSANKVLMIAPPDVRRTTPWAEKEYRLELIGRYGLRGRSCQDW